MSGSIILTNGELLITHGLSILGPGSANLAISANGNSRVFQVLSKSEVSISDLSICNGHANHGETGVSNAPTGGDANNCFFG